MKFRLVLGVLGVGTLGVLGVLVSSCAGGAVIEEIPDGSTTSEGGADAACPNKCGAVCTDLKTDSVNCGKCGTACPTGATCVAGNCQCGLADGGSTQTKCSGACVDTKTDNTNCGKCGTLCGNDAGPILGGGTWACTNGICGIQCPASDAGAKTECSGACVDTNTDNDNCGSCANSCVAMTEQCKSGLCCKTAEVVCKGADGGAPTCTNTMSDANNCNGCGKVCPMNTPNCNQGVCVAGVTYSESFTSGGTPSTQCTNWNTFRTALAGSYNSITIKGSNDMVGVTCTGAQANQLCQALHNNTAVNVGACNGRTWATGNCGPGLELTATGVICQCNSGYTARPCIGNLNWGGVNGTTCNAASQTITVLCQ